MSSSTRSAKRNADLLRLACLGLIVGPALTQADDLGFEEAPAEVSPVSVISATRLQQSPLDAPSAVTVIDRATIRASGARQIYDVLRLVPGMIVARESGSEAYVGYHGTSTFGNRRMQVQVDGRSLYQTGLAVVDWIGLPLDIEDVERIEVVRSPSSATHGANSFYAVINIITRHPQDVPNAELVHRAGEDGIGDSFARLSLSGLGGDWSWSAFRRGDRGFDTNLKREAPYRDDTRSEGLYGKGVWTTAQNGEFTFSLGGAHSTAQQERLNNQDLYRELPVATVDNAQATMSLVQPLGQRNTFSAQVSFNHFDRDEPWKVRLPYVVVSPELNRLQREDPDQARAFVEDPVATCTNPVPLLTNAALRDTCLLAISMLEVDPETGEPYLPNVDYNTDVSYRDQRTDIELSNTWTPNERFRMVLGGEALLGRTTSKTYLQGSASSTVVSLFSHIEWRFADQWLLNLGGNVERDDIAGSYFSPRAALSWQFDPRQALRLGYSEAVHTPDIFENQVDAAFEARTADRSQSRFDGVFYQRVKSDGTARTERIRSHELAYVAQFSRVAADVKFFRDDLELVDNTLGLEEFILGPIENYVLQGAELGSQWRLTPFQRLLLNYSHLDIDAPKGQPESNNTDIFARHSGSLMWSLMDPDGWRGSVAYNFYNDLNDSQQYFYDRLDLHIGRVVPLGQRQQLDLGVTAQYRLTDDPELRTANGVDSRHRIWASAAWRY